MADTVYHVNVTINKDHFKRNRIVLSRRIQSETHITFH